MDMLVRDVPDLPFLKLHDIGHDAHDEANGNIHNIQNQSAAPAMRRGNLVMVVEDQPSLSCQVTAICSYVGLNVEPVASMADLGLLLDERRPLALIAPFETEHQDGGHILKSVAMHDRDLPVMLLTGRNPVFLGAAEAMREILKLTAVILPEGDPTLGHMVEFLARAGQRNRRRRPTIEPDMGDAGA